MRKAEESRGSKRKRISKKLKAYIRAAKQLSGSHLRSALSILNNPKYDAEDKLKLLDELFRTLRLYDFRAAVASTNRLPATARSIGSFEQTLERIAREAHQPVSMEDNDVQSTRTTAGDEEMRIALDNMLDFNDGSDDMYQPEYESRYDEAFKDVIVDALEPLTEAFAESGFQGLQMFLATDRTNAMRGYEMCNILNSSTAGEAHRIAKNVVAQRFKKEPNVAPNDFVIMLNTCCATRLMCCPGEIHLMPELSPRLIETARDLTRDLIDKVPADVPVQVSHAQNELQAFVSRRPSVSEETVFQAVSGSSALAEAFKTVVSYLQTSVQGGDNSLLSNSTSLVPYEKRPTYYERTADFGNSVVKFAGSALAQNGNNEVSVPVERTNLNALARYEHKPSYYDRALHLAKRLGSAVANVASHVAERGVEAADYTGETLRDVNEKRQSLTRVVQNVLGPLAYRQLQKLLQTEGTSIENYIDSIKATNVTELREAVHDKLTRFAHRAGKAQKAVEDTVLDWTEYVNVNLYKPLLATAEANLGPYINYVSGSGSTFARDEQHFNPYADYSTQIINTKQAVPFRRDTKITLLTNASDVTRDKKKGTWRIHGKTQLPDVDEKLKLTDDNHNILQNALPEIWYESKAKRRMDLLQSVNPTMYDHLFDIDKLPKHARDALSKDLASSAKVRDARSINALLKALPDAVKEVNPISTWAQYPQDEMMRRTVHQAKQTALPSDFVVPDGDVENLEEGYFKAILTDNTDAYVRNVDKQGRPTKNGNLYWARSAADDSSRFLNPNEPIYLVNDADQSKRATLVRDKKGNFKKPTLNDFRDWRPYGLVNEIGKRNATTATRRPKPMSSKLHRFDDLHVKRLKEDALVKGRGRKAFSLTQPVQLQDPTQAEQYLAHTARSLYDPAALLRKMSKRMTVGDARYLNDKIEKLTSSLNHVSYPKDEPDNMYISSARLRNPVWAYHVANLVHRMPLHVTAAILGLNPQDRRQVRALRDRFYADSWQFSAALKNSLMERFASSGGQHSGKPNRSRNTLHGKLVGEEIPSHFLTGRGVPDTEKHRARAHKRLATSHCRSSQHIYARCLLF